MIASSKKSDWISMRGADWACVDYMLHTAQSSFRKNGEARKTVGLRPVRSIREGSSPPAVK
jgi:hypothetical protein